MSISPPSDIVMDVARAADPARYKQAVARLTTPGAAEPFPAVLEAAASGDGGKAVVPKTAPGDKAAETYRQFEAMALANMLESSMTGSMGDFFGKGVAGDTWKSLLIEKIADQMAKAGGIGIATELARSAHVQLKTADGGDAARAAGSMLVSHVERSVLRSLEPSEAEGT
jgi:Rod binding domain-containing protein